jgi:hypothetical protein
LGDLLEGYGEAHDAGLELAVRAMAEGQAAAQEGAAYLDALRQLLDAGQAYLLPRDAGEALEAEHGPRETFIGWQDGEGGAYLVPAVARQMVERLIGREGLGELSNQSLYVQLDELGSIGSKSGDQRTRVIKIGNRSRRVLHIAAAGLAISAED